MRTRVYAHDLLIWALKKKKDKGNNQYDSYTLAQMSLFEKRIIRVCSGQNRGRDTERRKKINIRNNK